MENKLKIGIIAAIFLLGLNTVSADVVINTDEWREAAVGMNYAELRGEDYRIVNNLGEAKLAPEIIEGRTTVLESRRHQSVENYEMFLKNRGIENVETEQLSWNSSYEYYSQLGKEVEGFLVVPSEFSEETVIGLPLATRENYLLLYYEKGRTERFLNRHKEKEAVFVGSFPEQPWEKIENSYRRVDEKSPLRNSLELAETYLEKKEGVKAAKASYLERGMSEKDPVILLKNAEKISEFLEENEAKFIEIIGPENVVYGNRIKELTGGNVRAIIKTARTFTGNPKLSGKEIPIQRIEAKPRTTEIRFGSAYRYNNTVGLEILNKGTSTAEVDIAALKTVNPEASLEINSSRHYIASNSSIAVEADYTGRTPEKLEILAYESGESLSATKEIERKLIESGNEIKTGKPVYLEDKRQLKIPVTNKGSSAVKVSAFLTDIELGGRELTLESSKEIEPGEENLKFDLFMDEEELGQEFNLSLAVGASKPYKWMGFEEKKVREVRGTAAFVNQKTGVLALILVIAAGYLVLRRFEIRNKLEALEVY